MRVRSSLVLLVVLSCNDPKDLTAPLDREVTIFVRADRFDPDDEDLAQGGEVTWRFVTTTPHNIIFEVNPSAPEDEETMHLGGEEVTREFPNDGNFRYYCREHPEMEGVIRVR